jgi:hypothetical protein
MSNLTSEADYQVWTIPGDPSDMAPLPALLRLRLDDTDLIAVYNRRQQEFSRFVPNVSARHLFTEAGPTAAVRDFSTFEECRAAMLAERSELLEELNATCRELAASIEHTRTIPTQSFPNVQREVREEQQGQEKAQAEKVPDAGEKLKPALTQPPSRKTGGKVDPKTPIT